MRSILSFLLGWALIIVTVVFSIHFIALDPSFYQERYETMELASEIDISKKDLNSSIELLMEYLKDERQDLDESVVWRGQNQQAFNQREVSHMVDVKNLYQSAMKVGYGSLVILVLFGILLFKRSGKRSLAFLSQGILRAVGCFLGACGFFGLWIFTDFTSFWTWFHTIFFSNDLWLLDPRTDLMINMLPETIFYQLVLTVTLTVILVLAPIVIYSFYYQKKKAPIGFEVER